MDFLVNLIYVENDYLLTFVNMFTFIFSLESMAYFVSIVASIGKSAIK